VTRRRCLVCDRPFPPMKRAGARTCSDACRQRLHRKGVHPWPGSSAARDHPKDPGDDDEGESDAASTEPRGACRLPQGPTEREAGAGRHPGHPGP
jgi:hypothetical protein